MRASSVLLAGCASVLWLDTPAWAGLEGDAFKNYGGVYAVDCARPASPRVSVQRTTLTLQNGGRRWVVRDPDAIYAWYGQQEPPPGFQVALSSLSGSHGDMAFMVKVDKQGQYIEIDDNPAVKAAIGAGLSQAKFRDCNQARNQRMARDLEAEARAAAAPLATSQATHPSDLLRSEAFKSAWFSALGPMAGERWMAGLEGPAPEVRREQLAGQTWLVAASCKPRDCGAHNLVLVYDELSGQVHALVQQRGQFALLGRPSGRLTRELQQIWRQEWRQRR